MLPLQALESRKNYLVYLDGTRDIVALNFDLFGYTLSDLTNSIANELLICPWRNNESQKNRVSFM
jgi:hypothetical protein